jgi:hypothetical protein
MNWKVTIYWKLLHLKRKSTSSCNDGVGIVVSFAGRGANVATPIKEKKQEFNDVKHSC